MVLTPMALEITVLRCQARLSSTKTAPTPFCKILSDGKLLCFSLPLLWQCFDAINPFWDPVHVQRYFHASESIEVP